MKYGVRQTTRFKKSVKRMLKRGKDRQFTAGLEDKPSRIIEHDETHVRCRWFEAI